MRTIHFALLALLSMTPSSAAGQSGGLPKVLSLPASTRALALGDAYMMNAGHSDVVFYHPALVTEASGFGLDLQRWSDASTAATVSAAMQWLGGGIAIGLQTLQYGLPSSTNVPPGQDHLFEAGSVQASERVATVAYGREVLGVSFGIAGKLAEERIGSSRDAVALMDLSAATEIGPMVVGLTVRDWGEDPLVGTGGVNPTRLVLGAGAYGQQVGPLDVGLAGSLSYADEQTVASAGLEVGYWPISGRTFVGRVGIQRVPEGEGSPVSFGLAFWGDDLVLEWAYRDYGEAGTHRFGVRFR